MQLNPLSFPPFLSFFSSQVVGECKDPPLVFSKIERPYSTTMEHNQHFSNYENIMRNYPLTVMTKTWKPQFPGPTPTAIRAFSQVMIPDRIREIVLKSPRLKTLIDRVSGEGFSPQLFLLYNIPY